MKQFLLTLILFSCFTLTSSAQFKLGVKAGANFADIKATEEIEALTDNSSITTHFHAGLSTHQQISQRFSVSADLLYSVKGFQNSIDFVAANDPSAKLALHYLSIPLMFNYSPNEKIHFGAGLEAGYLLDATTTVEGETNDVSFLYDKDFELSLNAGFRFMVSPNIFVDGRYQWGLSSISDIVLTNANGEPINNASLKNRLIQLSLGYFILR